MIRNIATLLTGNAVSQFVNVVTILFVVTAFFSPAEFGRYAVVMSYVGILSSVACLRYELSIVSVNSSIAANNAIFSCLVLAVLSGVLVLLALTLLTELWGDAFLIGSSPTVVALLVFLRAIDQIVASILYRHEAYFKYSSLKLVQALVLFSGFTLAGIGSQGMNGLLLSTIAAYTMFALGGMVVVWRFRVHTGVQLKRMKVQTKRNVDFVKFSTPQTLIDNLLSNGLNIVLIGLAGPAVVGYFSYMQRILKAPLGLVFGSISQVVFRFSAKSIANPDVVRRKLGQTLVLVVTIILLALIAVGFAYLFFNDIAFLANWAGMRPYIFAFSVWMLVPFIFSPFATLPIVYRRQKQFFQIATAFNVLSLLAITLIIWKGSVVGAFWTVGLASIVYYVGVNKWLLRIAGSGRAS